MDILVFGGTNYFGIPMVKQLMSNHNITIATRGNKKDEFGSLVKRVYLDRFSRENIEKRLKGNHYDIIIDKLAYGSSSIRDVLDFVSCNRYVMVSTSFVYDPKHLDMVEEEFDPRVYEIKPCYRNNVSYKESKRQAEAYLSQNHSNYCCIRLPYVVGKNDYTKRLEFFVENIKKSNPMNIDNIKSSFSYIEENVAANFISFMAVESKYMGEINAPISFNTTIENILDYISKSLNKDYIISSDGVDAPFNGEISNSLNMKKANMIYKINVNLDVLHNLLDYYMRN